MVRQMNLLREVEEIEDRPVDVGKLKPRKLNVEPGSQPDMLAGQKKIERVPSRRVQLIQ